MDTTEAVKTKLDVREFSQKHVPTEVKLAVLEAGRLNQSGSNTQHWRFILVQDKENLKTLADDSSTGRWVAGADFAVIICTDPNRGYHLLDAGRAAQDMQLTAWDHGVTSCIYTGFKLSETRRDFGIPEDSIPSAVLGFGYPAKKLLGKKNRKPLREVAYLEKFGKSIDSLKA